MSRLATLEQQAQCAIRERLVQRLDPAVVPAIRRALLRDALQSWPSPVIGNGIVIALVVVGLVFSANPLVAGGTALLVIGVGGIALGGWLWLALQDDSRRQRAVAAQLPDIAVFSLAALRDKNLRSRLLLAARGWQQIQAASHSMPTDMWRNRAATTAVETTDWLHHAYLLARQADRLLLSTALSQPSLLKSSGPAASIRQVIAQRMQQTYRQLDGTVAGLDDIYTQLLLIAASGPPGRQAGRLEADISAEIGRLQDLTAAMHEVYDAVSAG